MADNLLEQLQALLKQKKSNEFYATKLGIPVEDIKELREELKQRQKEAIEWARGIFKDKEFKEESDRAFKDILVYGHIDDRRYKLKGKVKTEPQIVGEDTNHETGDQTLTIQATKPLSPKELEELAQTDGINTFVARTWLKSHKNGIWTYSIDVRYRVNDFYTKEELKAKIEELLPDYTYVRPPKEVRGYSESALFIYIADDHCGAMNENSVFENDYSPSLYDERLHRIVDKIESFDSMYEKVYVISLGDQLNGWNQQTTRGGHIVRSLSNKEQFDIYVSARKRFYDELFSLPITNEFVLYSLENSNHSGLGFSYMADQALKFYVEAKYPRVEVVSTALAIDTISYGDHVFALVHGKDERQQKTPFPLNLNDRTDGYFYQYFDRKGYSAYDYNLHVIKGDLHQFSINKGKSCRYVNVPSIMGAGEYSEINFGDNQPGAIIEIVEKESPNVLTLPLWF